MIPKRALSALLTTAFALALLFSFKTPASPSLAGSTTSDTAIVGAPTTTDTGTTTGTTTDVGTTATATPTPTPTQATTDSTTTTTSGYVDGTVTGATVSTRFGEIQVQVTIAGGVITDVSALQLPSGDRHSAQISQAVEPILREETLTAQSASIDLLSGATYTSEAYAESLQSALDQARA